MSLWDKSTLSIKAMFMPGFNQGYIEDLELAFACLESARCAVEGHDSGMPPCCNQRSVAWYSQKNIAIESALHHIIRSNVLHSVLL